MSSGVSKPVVCWPLSLTDNVAAISDQFCVETGEGEMAKISVRRAREESGLIARSIWLWAFNPISIKVRWGYKASL